MRHVLVALALFTVAACAEPSIECAEDGRTILCDGQDRAVYCDDGDCFWTGPVCGERWARSCTPDGQRMFLGDQVNIAVCGGGPAPSCVGDGEARCVTIPCDGEVHGGADYGP